MNKMFCRDCKFKKFSGCGLHQCRQFPELESNYDKPHMGYCFDRNPHNDCTLYEERTDIFYKIRKALSKRTEMEGLK